MLELNLNSIWYLVKDRKRSLVIETNDTENIQAIWGENVSEMFLMVFILQFFSLFAVCLRNFWLCSLLKIQIFTNASSVGCKIDWRGCQLIIWQAFY